MKIAAESLSAVLEDVHVPLSSLRQDFQGSDQFVPLPASIFDHTCHPSLTHLLVRQHLASLRQGTHANKSRFDVNYSKKKIQRQKGTGRARVGDRGSPIRRGGGRTFAKQPKDYSFHVNRKMVDIGVRAALSTRWRNDELTVLQDVGLDWGDAASEGKTSIVKSILDSKGWLKPTLFLLGQETLVSKEGQLLERGMRNLQNAEIMDTFEGLNVYHLLKPSRIVMDLHAVGEVCEHFLAEEEQYVREIAAREASLEDLEDETERGEELSDAEFDVLQAEQVKSARA